MTRIGATRDYLKDYKFLANCSSSKKRKSYLSKCNHLSGLVGHVQSTSGKLANLARLFSDVRTKKLLKKRNQLTKVAKQNILARQLTLNGNNFLKDIFKFVSKNPEVISIPLAFLKK